MRNQNFVQINYITDNEIPDKFNAKTPLNDFFSSEQTWRLPGNIL